jgi:hypothetical protein
MKKQLIINPVGLKGNEILERQKQLMGISSINEDRKNYAVELTKIGPDGNAYAVIRENHEWYIKKTNKVKNLIAEDFNYIGGLQNKKQEAYPSYAKAIKHLNLKFKSLAEAYNFDGEINVFENDNLLSETPMAAGFAEMKSNGFTNEGNLEGDEPMMEYDIDEVELTEYEQAIDAMIDDNSEDDGLIGYKVPEWAMSSLINGDDSGLSEEDIEKLNSFVKDVSNEHGNASFMLGDIEGEDDLGFRHSNDIDSLGSNVYRIYIKPSKNIDEHKKSFPDTPEDTRRIFSKNLRAKKSDNPSFKFSDKEVKKINKILKKESVKKKV